MSTLSTYWSGEVARLTLALSDTRAALSSARTALGVAQQAGRLAADAVRSASDAVDAARRALGGIPMPADGDPLLVAMAQALITLREAQQAQSRAELGLLQARGEQRRLELLEADTQAELAQAQTAQSQAQRSADERQAVADALTLGAWATLVPDATQALTDFEATARARVEGEFPSHATASKDLLKRVRARRALVTTSATQALEAEALAFQDSHDALAQAQRRFDEAWQAVRTVIDAAPRLADARDALSRLAALPAPVAGTRYPIVTVAQHDALFHAGLKAKRESMLVKLSTADDAEQAARSAQLVYDKKLYAAMKAHPGQTRAELEATVLAADLVTLNAALLLRQTTRDDLQSNAADYAVLQAWFAAVPDTLWEALDQLDTAIARLNQLKHADVPANLLAAVSAREADLVAALEAATLSRRTQQAATQAALIALNLQQAEASAAARRARAVSRSTAAL